MWCYEAGPTARGIGMKDVNMSPEHAVSHFTCLSTFLSVSELSWSDFNNMKLRPQIHNIFDFLAVTQ